MENSDTTDLLDTFKAAALSVTRLYKTSAAAATKARSDGYQECLDDLLAFLDKNKLVGDRSGAGAAIKQWATERQEGREISGNTGDSDDDAERPADPPSSPVTSRPSLPTTSHTPSRQQHGNDIHMQSEQSAPASAANSTTGTSPSSTAHSTFREPIVVPTRDSFTFQTSVAYPPVQVQHSGEYPNLASLELSDSNHASLRSTSTQSSTQSPAILKSRMRASNDNRNRSGRSHGVRSVAGQKRRIDLNELFELQSIGKDGFPFGPGGNKRPRHG